MHDSPTPLTAFPAPKLAGRVRVPGDKSISHRALIFGSLAVGETAITGLLEGADVIATANAVRALGAEVTRQGEGAWQVFGMGVSGYREPANVLDMGNSGTGARLLMGAVAGNPVRAVFMGDASLSKRPMLRILTPLSQMGARFSAREGGRLPVTLEGAAPPLPIAYTLPVASAQVKSAILLAGLGAPGETTVIEPVATRDHTERLLRHFGAEVSIEDGPAGVTAVRLKGQPELTGQAVQVPADPSSAAFLMVAALTVEGSELVLEGVMLNPGRTGLIDTLKEMGGDLTIENERVEGGEPVGDIVVRHSALSGIEVPPERAASMIDEYPVLCAAAAQASGATVMRGLEELRVKESDRIAMMAQGLAACGVDVEEHEDGLTVYGRPGEVRGGGTVATSLDHRIAMSFLTLGLAAQKPVTVDDSTMIDTSFPGFAELMRGLGAQLSVPNT